MRRWLIGKTMRIEYLWQRMYRGGFYPGDRLIGSTIAGIDIALWDIKGQALGVPVYELLGGRSRDYVECFFHRVMRRELWAPPRNRWTTCSKPWPAVIQKGAGELAKRMLANGHKYFRTGPQADNGLIESPRRRTPVGHPTECGTRRRRQPDGVDGGLPHPLWIRPRPFGSAVRSNLWACSW